MDFRDTGGEAGLNDRPLGDMMDVLEADKADMKAALQKDEAKPEAKSDSKITDSKTVDVRRFDVVTDTARDDLLTEFGKETLRDRYLLPGENYQDLFARVARPMPTIRIMPSGSMTISAACGSCRQRLCCRTAAPDAACRSRCYLNSVDDSLEGIVNTWNENVWLASRGGGIGTYWGSVRGIGEPVGLNGKTSGIIPFVRVMDSLTLAISQGSLRRGSAACYLDVSHPEIEEFLEIRKPSGDFNRKALNLHHGVLLTDEFMEAVRDGDEFNLRSPQGRQHPRHRRCAQPVPEAGRNPAGDGRTLYRLQRHREPDDAQASPRSGAESLDLQPVRRNHPAHRPRPSGR